VKSELFKRTIPVIIYGILLGLSMEKELSELGFIGLQDFRIYNHRFCLMNLISLMRKKAGARRGG